MNRLLAPIFLFVSLAFIITGCKEGASTPLTPVMTSLPTYQPKGTITGLIRDRITNVPVYRAVISVAFEGTVKSTTSDTTGGFSFANLPAGNYQVVNGTAVLTGNYTFTVSLVAYNNTQADPNKKYRNFYYSTSTITFTSITTGDSAAVSDMVGSVLLQISQLNTAITGQVVDQNQQPVANAIVMLSDVTVVPSIVIGQATTSNAGLYQFSHVDNGLTVNISAQSADGSIRGTLPAFMTLPANVDSINLLSQVTAERIELLSADDINPFVISISPENNADVSPTNFQIVYSFSESIKQTAYTRTDLPLGHSTMLDDIVISYLGLKKTASAVPFSAQWNATHTQLTLIPSSSQISGSSRYSADPSAAFNSGKITDIGGKALVNNAQITGDFEPLLFSLNGTSTTPASPTISRRIIAGSFAALDFNGGAIGLEWGFDNNARSYNIYKSTNGGSFQLLQMDFYGLQFTENTGALAIPSASNNPLRSSSVAYLVRAVSKDLVESVASNVITIVDERRPRLTNATVVTAGSANSWIYTLTFSEPLNIASAENISNYGFSNTGAVVFTTNSASYLGFNAGVYVVQLGVTTSAALPVGYVLTAQNGVLDLAGNAIDPTSNSKTF